MNSTLAELSGVRHGPEVHPSTLGWGGQGRAEGGNLGLEAQARASPPYPAMCFP